MSHDAGTKSLCDGCAAAEGVLDEELPSGGPAAAHARSRRTARWLSLSAFFALVLYALAFQGSRPLWEPDEGRYTAVAIEMLRSGDWWTPHLNPEVRHLTKPPLTYWSIAVSLAALGRTELAARLPNALAFVATVLLVVGVARRLDLEKPWVAGLIYATALLPYVAANVVTTDTLLALWLALAGFAFVSAYSAADRSKRRWWLVLMWSGFGLGFLTKGPVSLLPLAAFVAFCLLTGGRAGARQLLSVPGLVVFSVVGFGWFAAQIAADPRLLGYFVGSEVVARVATADHGRHGEWYGGLMVYLPTLLIGGMPWIGLAAREHRAIGRLVRGGAWRRWRRMDQPLLLLLLWFLVPLGVLFLARSRLPLYLLPLFVPLSVLLARSVETRWRAATPALMAGVAVWVALLIGIRWGATLVAPEKSVAAAAAAISRAVDTPIEEVVIVEGRAGSGYGFDFYLDCSVEHVALAADDVVVSRGRVSDLAGELAEGDGPESRIFAVPERSLGAFRRTMDGYGETLRLVATWEDMRLFSERSERVSRVDPRSGRHWRRPAARSPPADVIVCPPVGTDPS